MKKLTSLLLALAMICAIFAGCNNTQTTTPTDTKPADTTEKPADTTPAAPEAQGPESALAAMEAIWNAHDEDSQFMAFGGNAEEPVMGAPGKFNLENAEALAATLYIPEDQIGSIDDAATLLHMMNANTFTGAVLHVTSDAKAFGDTMKDAILKTQWICGMPDHLMVANLGGGYVAVAFGEAEIMGNFEKNLTAVFAGAEILHSEDIVLDF